MWFANNSDQIAMHASQHTMPSTPITEAILLRLVEIGKSGDFPRPGSFFTASEQRRYSEITRLRPETWYSAVESLSTEDLVALIKCLTVAERRLEGWKAGSVSPVIWLFRRLAALDSNLADSIVDWIWFCSWHCEYACGRGSKGRKLH